MNPYQKLALLALAGGLGSLSRYGLAGAVQRMAGSAFPWGTATVNVLGCFLFGLLWALGETRLGLSGEVRAIVLTGFMGAFTTFSTYIFETRGLAADAQYLPALLNVLGQTLVGFACMLGGLAAGRAL